MIARIKHVIEHPNTIRHNDDSDDNARSPTSLLSGYNGNATESFASMHAYLVGGRNTGQRPYTGQRPFSWPEAVYLARGRATGESGDATGGPGEFARQASLLED